MKLKFSNFLIFLTYHDCAPNSTATRSDGGNLESIPPDHTGETSFHVPKTWPFLPSIDRICLNTSESVEEESKTSFAVCILMTVNV